MTLEELELNLYNMWAVRPTSEACDLLRFIYTKPEAVAQYHNIVDVYRGYISKHDWALQYAKRKRKSVRTGYRALAKSLNIILDIINEGE